MDTALATIDRLTALEKRLLDGFQRGFPLSPRPYAELAAHLDSDEATVIGALKRLTDARLITRVGAVMTPHKAGWSTLAALAVPSERLDQVADLVSAVPEVNHNYEREHRFNLWFVVTACDQDAVGRVLRSIEAETGLPVLALPLVEAYRLDLGFPLQWT
jgi:DNA-binding Lrp family transcriptional regulator